MIINSNENQQHLFSPQGSYDIIYVLINSDSFIVPTELRGESWCY